ncbi:hypothetical protein ElyMa_003653000 [Elysia marginata]|uniref:Uncharacterized protein n=1 Tax=Elysia marginata TaxID=1093978 RepID=A0AAV4EW94_9GAST|nr:hypothetical protein ElyMa_003653000 [Elysia marginata]
MRSSVETGFGLAPCLVLSSVPTLTYRPSARPAVSEVSRMHSYFIFILIIIINMMSGKIVRIITTTIIIIITYGNLSINISSHTNRQEKDKNCHWQYKIVESGVAKVDHI